MLNFRSEWISVYPSRVSAISVVSLCPDRLFECQENGVFARCKHRKSVNSVVFISTRLGRVHTAIYLEAGV